MKNINDSVSKLEEIKKLFDSELITENDYQELKESVFSDYIIENNKNKPHKEVESPKEIKSAKRYYGWFVLYLLLNLGFHFAPSKMLFFPKDHFTFSNTILTDDDINSIISRYNNAGITEKTIILQDPLINKLFEKGLIIPEAPKPAPESTPSANQLPNESNNYEQGD
jgi:hypothetical protein